MLHRVLHRGRVTLFPMNVAFIEANTNEQSALALFRSLKRNPLTNRVTSLSLRQLYEIFSRNVPIAYLHKRHKTAGTEEEVIYCTEIHDNTHLFSVVDMALPKNEPWFVQKTTAFGLSEKYASLRRYLKWTQFPDVRFPIAAEDETPHSPWNMNLVEHFRNTSNKVLLSQMDKNKEATVRVTEIAILWIIEHLHLDVEF